MDAIVGPTNKMEYVKQFGPMGSVSVQYVSVGYYWVDNFATADHQMHITDGGKNDGNYNYDQCNAKVTAYRTEVDKTFKNTIQWDKYNELFAAWRTK